MEPGQEMVYNDLNGYTNLHRDMDYDYDNLKLFNKGLWNAGRDH